MRRIHALLVLSSLPLVTMGAVEGQWTYIAENGGATITASTATGAVTIPSILSGLPVKKVGSIWPPVFGDTNSTVTSVTIPNSVTSIEYYAFAYCSKLASVTFIPTSSVTLIGEAAFRGCTSLTSIVIPESVTSIGFRAFVSCTSLASVTFGSTTSLTSIGRTAFNSCTSLTSIAIPESVMSIGDQAFGGCTSLTTAFLPIRFETIFYNFGLTESQARFGVTLTATCNAAEGTIVVDPSKLTYTGESVTINATPKVGYLFNNWSGDITATTSSITLRMDSKKVVTANFSQDTRDNDNDGLTNFQEYITYGTNPNQKDSNSDGVEDGVVVSLGYSPTFNFSALTARWRTSPPTGLYTGSQYSENYTAGQQSVISSPNMYNLYTITQYNDHLTTGFNAGREAGKAEGRAEVTSFPFSYSLYTATQYIANFLAGQQSVLFSPNIYNLYTAQQYANNFTAGKDSVLNTPNSNGLYTISQIQDMSMGGLVLTKNGNGFTLNYSIEKSNDLGAWTQYQSFTLPLSGLSPDKVFVRLKMANSSSGSSSQAADQAAAEAAARAALEAARAALYQAEQAQREAMLKDAQANLASAQANLAAAQAAGDPAAQAAALANLEAAQANLATAQASAQVPPSATPVGSNL